MWVTSSLSNRIFLACTLLATLSLGFAFSFVNANATDEAEADLRRALQESATLADQQRLTTLTDTLSRMARLVADLPRLKAAVETGDAPTVQPHVDDYRTVMQADLLWLYDRNGQPLGHVGGDDAALPDVGGPQSAEEYSLFVPTPRGPLQIVSVPILLGTRGVEISRMASRPQGLRTRRQSATAIAWSRTLRIPKAMVRPSAEALASGSRIASP